jgi:DNA-binding HxlR family transcriptional regulator
MIEYGQFCPIAKASEVLGERWTNLVVRELGAGSETFNDLRRGLPLISPSLLSARLKSLEAAGVVTRTETGKNVRYALTEAGRELKPILLALGAWGQRWARTEFDEKDLDPSMLMWDIHRTMKADFFGENRTVLLFEFSDYTSRFRRWWLVVDKGEVDVCMKDPGYDVDLHVLTDTKTLASLWLGEITYTHAIRTKHLVMAGPEKFKRTIRTWLGTNYFAGVKPGIVPAK